MKTLLSVGILISMSTAAYADTCKDKSYTIISCKENNMGGGSVGGSNGFDSNDESENVNMIATQYSNAGKKIAAHFIAKNLTKATCAQYVAQQNSTELLSVNGGSGESGNETGGSGNGGGTSGGRTGDDQPASQTSNNNSNWLWPFLIFGK